MSTEVDALTPKIDQLVNVTVPALIAKIHDLQSQIGTAPAVSPEDASTLSSDGGKLDAVIAAANAALA